MGSNITMGRGRMGSMNQIIGLITAAFLAVAGFAATGSAGFDTVEKVCQDNCNAQSFEPFESLGVRVKPNNKGQWPIVVESENDPGVYRCDNPNSPNAGNYPCLAWPYDWYRFSGPNNLKNAHVLVPNCCGQKIDILWTSAGEPEEYECDNSESKFKNVCSGFELRLMDASEGTSGTFWFTTPDHVASNMIDISFGEDNGDDEIFSPCLYGIKGPGCSPVADVRVEPRSQCWQFTAEENLNCPEAQDQTWYAEWAGSDPCAVDVWVADGIVPCGQVQQQGTKLKGEPLDDITLTFDNVEQSLKEALDTNSRCSEGWLRFIDEQGCNARCYRSGGRRYCY